MASDRLVQLGNQVGRVQKEIKNTSRTYAKNLPVIEKSNDVIGSLYTYRLEFKTYTENHSVFLNVKFFEYFRKL